MRAPAWSAWAGDRYVRLAADPARPTLGTLTIMMGRNHAITAATGWVLAAPAVSAATGTELDAATLAVTTLIAAGAGVIPDLDHPDSGPARRFGIVSRLVAAIVNTAAGGHRMLTHSLPFVAAATFATWAAVTLTTNPLPAAILVGFCIGVGISLLGPSLGFRIPGMFAIGLGVASGYATATNIEVLAPLLPFLVGWGCLCHLLTDGVTKGGIPLFAPFSRKRYSLGLMRTNGLAENLLSVVFVLGFLAAVSVTFNEINTIT